MSSKISHNRIVFVIFSLTVVINCCCSKSPGYDIAERVILIGLDGLSISDIRRADLTNLKRIVSEGAHTANAIGVHSSQKAPAWAGILCGAGPEQHSVDSDDWTITQRQFNPVDMDFDGYFPNIFYLVHQKLRHGKSGIFYDWPGMINLFNLYYLHAYEPTKNIDDIPTKALPFILEHPPSLTLLYFGYANEKRIQHGDSSTEYLDALRRLDGILGDLLAELAHHGIDQTTHMIFVSGQGGVVTEPGKDLSPHGSYLWIAWGPGICRNTTIQSEVYLYDTAATIAHLFGIKPPPSWIGRPVVEIFADPSSGSRSH